ncbi:MAG: autotransporter-associated beta strand repeat-containing protein [Verrucomicrobiota bacterium]
MRALYIHKLISLALALLTSVASLQAGTWNQDTDGTWSDSGKWLGGLTPEGIDAIADFSTLDILGTRTVTLESPHTVGHLIFGDLAGSQGWLITTNGSTDPVLTLATSAGVPTVSVNNSAATNRVILGGTQGLVKVGAGSLTLQGSANSYSGQTVVSNGTLFLNKSSVAIPGDLLIESGATVFLLGANDQIADAAVVTVKPGGTLNLNNRSDTINRLILDGGVITNVSASPTLQSTDSFEVHSGEVYSILAGAGKVLVKTTSGTALLNAANTYSGGVLISDGVLQIGKGGMTGTPGASGIAITNNAQLVFNRGATLTVSGVISGSGSVTKLGDGTVALSGPNTYTGTTTISNGLINLGSASTLGDGFGTLNLAGGTLNTTSSRSASSAPVSNPINLTADSAITTTSSATTVDLNLTSSAISGTSGTLTFRNDGANDSTDLFDPRFSGSDFVFTRPIVVNNGSGLTRLNSFNPAGTTQTFNGPISGTGSFRRSVSSGTGGTTVFNGTNTYSGTTLVNDGVLLVNGGLGTNAVSVTSGASLGGNGTILGPVNLLSGGTLSPGNSIGTLTISNSLIFSSGSKALIDIDPISPANDRVSGLSNVTYGGALQLNLSGALSAGDMFQLFQATTYSGAFSSVSPAIPGSGLAWNTNLLNINGVISVVSTNAIQQPAMTNVTRLNDGRIQFAFSGSPGQNYRVWASSDLSLTPVTNTWTVLTNDIFHGAVVQFIDPDATNHSQRFYLLTIP